MQGLLQIILHIVSIIVETMHKVILKRHSKDCKDKSLNYSHDYDEDRKEE